MTKKMMGSGAAHKKGGGAQGRGGTCDRKTPNRRQGPGCRLRVATGGGGEDDAGYDGRFRHAARGTERAA